MALRRALPNLLLLSLLLLVLTFKPDAAVKAQSELGDAAFNLMTTDAAAAALADWTSTTSSALGAEAGSLFDGGETNLGNGEIELGSGGESERRSLYYYYRKQYYISYGALSANRIPCPPRSGRSYYTNHCNRQTRQANPYSRGCSAIARCRR